VFGLIRKSLGTVERIVLSVDAVAGSHMRSDLPLSQPLQELPVPVRCVGRHRFWRSSLPLRETGQHVLRGHRFLAHTRRRGLHSYDHAVVIVHQIVVVVPIEPARRLWWCMHRFLHRVLLRDSESGPQAITDAGGARTTPKSTKRWGIVAPIAAVLILGFSVALWLLHAQKVQALSATDTVVLAGFDNTTGDAVFDDTLRQGLEVQLEQSPFLSIISSERMRQTLRLMNQPPDTRLTPAVARDLCQRVGSKAYISGSIASLGHDYVVALHAVNCATGDSLAQEQEQAPGKEKVLGAMSRAATDLRKKLGESLNTVLKFDTPIEATTSSLEALKAFSVASKGEQAEAVPSLQRAVKLDPNFASAYAALESGIPILAKTAWREKPSVKHTRCETTSASEKSTVFLALTTHTLLGK